MTFRTVVNIPRSLHTVSYQSALMTMGSCFVEHIGGLLTRYKFPVVNNPFGVLYNPLSMEQAIRSLLDVDDFQADGLVYRDGLWHSWQHHGSFSGPNKDQMLKHLNTTIEQSGQVLQQAEWLILTFGTSYVYELKENGMVVANCHKFPGDYFNRRLVPFDESLQKWTDLFDELFNLNPSLKVVVTVSPVRHLKDGAHENQISKSHLLLLTEQLLSRFPEQVQYFPAYEILLDELRDYRFYKSDMLHPSNEAVQYIWRRFTETFMNEPTLDIMKEVKAIKDAVSHRPLHPESHAHQQFLKATLAKIDALETRFPEFNWAEEKAYLLNRL